MITMMEYAKRRKKVLQSIGKTSIMLIPSAPMALRNGDAFYPYRQNSDFYYLTGFNEPEAVAVLAPNRKEGEFILFNRPRHRDEEVWDGKRAGQKGACQHFLADQSFPMQELTEKLPALLAGREAIYFPVGKNKCFDTQIFSAVKQIRAKIRGGVKSPTTFVDVGIVLHEMRLIKSAGEKALLQKAVDITVTAHLAAMRTCRPGILESDLHAELMYEFLQQGAASVAYSSIVGSGKNTCTLHYTDNNQPIRQGSLVLIDAGAEYHNYAADITRTFPANGKFSAEQRAVYEIVLAAQLAGIKAIRPGAAFDAYHRAIVNVLTAGLVELGLLKGRVHDLIEKKAYLPFFMHKSGHWLGLDVHDAGSYNLRGKSRSLQAGMVLTVEPGIYITADIPRIPARWHNIGVRIEDDIIVTAKGCEVLSAKLPKTVGEIEAVMQG